VAAVISIQDLHTLERLAEEEMDRLDIEAARAALAERGARIILEALKKDLEYSQTTQRD
jgi:hypothetical protein